MLSFMCQELRFSLNSSDFVTSSWAFQSKLSPIADCLAILVTWLELTYLTTSGWDFLSNLSCNRGYAAIHVSRVEELLGKYFS